MIYQQFQRQCSANPDKASLIIDGQSISFIELSEMSEIVAEWLVSYGVKTGEHIATLLDNSIEMVCFMLAAAKLNLVMVPLYSSLPAKSLLTALKTTGTRRLVYIKNNLSNSDLELLESFVSRQDYNATKQLAFSYLEFANSSFSTNQSDRAELQFESTESLKSKYAGDKPYIITMTSGSTGQPKPILLSQKTKLERIAAAISLYDIRDDDVVLATTPLYHSLAERLVLLSLTRGLTCVLTRNFSPKSFVQAIAENQVSFTIAVSSQLRRLIDNAIELKEKVRTLRCIVSSSERLELNVKLKLIELLECDFHECYGTSEISIATNLSLQDTKQNDSCVGSVGRAAPGVDIKILGENEELLNAGQTGEIICKSKLSFCGYLGEPEVTQNCYWQDYFKTGDLGYLDESGFLYYCGRKKDIIITGGINVYPQDIEKVIALHPKVTEVVVIGLADDNLGEKVTAVISTIDRTPIKEAELRKLCLEFLADFQFPRKYVFLERIPKSRLGKISRHHLVNLVEDI